MRRPSLAVIINVCIVIILNVTMNNKMVIIVCIVFDFYLSVMGVECCL